MRSIFNCGTRTSPRAGPTQVLRADGFLLHRRSNHGEANPIYRGRDERSAVSVASVVRALVEAGATA